MSPKWQRQFIPLLFVTAALPSLLPEKTETNKQNQTATITSHFTEPSAQISFWGSLSSVAEQMEFVWMGVGGIPTLHLGNGGEDVGSVW